MIYRIKFTNYRIFSKEQDFTLAPLTIVIGKNNTGKSALMQLPILIDDMLNETSDEVLSKKYRDLSMCHDFRDLIYGKANRAMGLEFISDQGACLKLSFFVDETKNPKTRIESWELTDAEGHGLDIETIHQEQGCPVVFKGIRPDNLNNYDWAEKTFDSLRLNTDILGAIRNDPLLDYRPEDPKYPGVGYHGENAYYYLAKDTTEGDGALLNKVSGWCEKNFDSWQIEVDSGSLPYHFMMRNGVLHTSLLEAGTGVLQSIPVLVSAAMERKDPTLCIFIEPGAHLHPAAQPDIAQFIAGEIKGHRNKRALVETHSFNFILRIRSLVAEGFLKPDDVALYYIQFSEKDAQSSLHRINIDKYGNVDFWPQGIFNESLEEATRLRRAQRDNRL